MTAGRTVARDATVGANLLVALLLRYPAIGTAHVDTKGKRLRLTFLVTDKGPDGAALLHGYLQEMLGTYFSLEEISPEQCEMGYDAHEGLGLIHIIRDLDSVTQGEIALIVEVIEERLGTGVRYEAPEASVDQDDLMMQEEWIGYMLENIKKGDDPQSLLAFREDGRVLVYNATRS